MEGPEGPAKALAPTPRSPGRDEGSLEGPLVLLRRAPAEILHTALSCHGAPLGGAEGNLEPA